MKILVTGATGQLGHAVALALIARGDAVRCLVRDPKRAGGLDCEHATGDVCDPGSLTAAVRGVDAVVHLAGTVSYNPARFAEMRRVNVDGTRNLLDAAAVAGVGRVLLTSSIATLGYLTDPGEIGDETTPYNWQGEGIAYFDTKREAEQAVLSDTRLDGLAVNPGITFGAYDVHKNAGRMILQVAAGGPFALPCGATSVVNLDDVVSGHLLALDRGARGQRYVLVAEQLLFAELYGKIAQILGKPAPTRVLKPWQMHLIGALGDLRQRLGGPEPTLSLALAKMSSRNRRYRSDKAQRELGWTASPIEEGIRACFGWYREHGYVDSSLPHGLESPS